MENHYTEFIYDKLIKHSPEFIYEKFINIPSLSETFLMLYALEIKGRVSIKSQTFKSKERDYCIEKLESLANKPNFAGWPIGDKINL